MTLQKMAARAALAAGLTMAGWAIAPAAGTAAAGASIRADNASLSASGAGRPVSSQAASRAGRPVSSQDRMFMNQASQINLAEIALGKYVQAHASTTMARNLGAVYARDHAAAQASLRALASRLRVTLPTTPGVQVRSMIARVEAEKGRSLDVAFARTSVSGHRSAVAIFRRQDRSGSNPAVKAYAIGYLPMLRTHLILAEHAESVLHVTPSMLSGGDPSLCSTAGRVPAVADDDTSVKVSRRRACRPWPGR